MTYKYKGSYESLPSGRLVTQHDDYTHNEAPLKRRSSAAVDLKMILQGVDNRIQYTHETHNRYVTQHHDYKHTQAPLERGSSAARVALERRSGYTHDSPGFSVQMLAAE